jgi:hypothetical protein
MISAAALANGSKDLNANEIIEFAWRQDGTEGFAFDTTGRKTDVAFHADPLGDAVSFVTAANGSCVAAPGTDAYPPTISAGCLRLLICFERAEYPCPCVRASCAC